MSETNIVALHDHLPQQFRRRQRTTALLLHLGRHILLNKVYSSLSLSLRSLSFSQKVIKKYKHTCRHAIREKCVSPKEAFVRYF
jgi:hypothetical protein